MKLRIETKVNASLDAVKSGFTQDLFLKLNPPFPPVKLLEFGGCKEGDKVALQLNFILFKQTWISDITEDYTADKRWFFVDQGTQLPFFLKTWKHHHEVQSKGNSALIIDDIHYTTGTLLTDVLMYLPLLGQFLYRKPIYKKIFNS